MSCKEMLGIRFDKLLVVERAKNLKDGTASWICLCDCGETRKIPGTKLRAGKHKSCGCSSPKFNSGSASTHGMSGSRAYKIWAGMNSRCRNLSNKKAHLYFEKGIKVCERWKKFENFFEDMGNPPDGASIDRINGNGHYEPSNCRWANTVEQANNMSRNRLLKHDGEEMTIAMWARKVGLKPNTIYYRLKRGSSIKEALETQVLVVANKQRKT